MRLMCALTVAVRTVDGKQISAEGLHKRGAYIMEHLMSAEVQDRDIADAAVSADALLGSLTIELLVTDSTAEGAILKFLSKASRAVQAATEWVDRQDDDQVPNLSFQNRRMEISYL